MNNIMEILDKMQFFGGQRAGRELWENKPTDVQNTDIEAFNKDIESIRDYIQQLERERNAAVTDIRNSRNCCRFCKYDDGMYCKSTPKPLDHSCFEWRGITEATT